MMMRYLVIVGLLLLSSCGLDSPEPTLRSGAAGPPPEDLRTLELPLEAPCTINVDDVGAVSIEDEYVAGVVACENGNAPMEALKAQAIQARGYLYYVMLITGADSIGNSQSDQVYSCDYTTPGPRHFEAARATRGQFLSWDSAIIAPFYVAGAIPADQSSGAAEDACIGAGGADSTTTEQWVTYNLGTSGCGIDMTPLGWIPDDGDCTRNKQNRGCASQNGQACLASRGWFHDQMHPYYYGEDILIEQATGTCGGASADPPNYDAYCMRHDEPSYCVNDAQRVLCHRDSADTVENCSEGCFQGECQGDIEDESFCDSRPDGWVCLDSDTRVQCASEEVAATEDCSAGCESDLCSTVDDDPDDPDDDPDPTPDADGDSDGNVDPLTEERPGDLLTTSAGISGGCSQSTNRPGAPSFLLLALLAIGVTRSRRRRADPSSYLVP